MDVFLVPLGAERHELYCEPSDDDEKAAENAATPGFFARMRRRFSEMLRAAEAARARRARGEYDPIDTWWERTRARVLAKVADAVAEQRLLWHLRHETAADLHHPSDMSSERALALIEKSFFAVALAWQIAFLIIGSNPLRFRPLMIPAMIEKLGLVVTLAVLYSQGRVPAVDFQAALPDGTIGLLFIAAFLKTRRLIPADPLDYRPDSLAR